MGAAILGDFHAALGATPDPSGLTDSIKAWWPCHEESGDREDASGNGFTLTEHSEPVPSQQGLFGGLAAEFTATIGSFLITESGLVTSGPVSFSFWMKAAGTTGMIEMASGSTCRFSTGTDAFRFTFGETTNFLEVTGFTDNTWFHVVGTFADPAANLYVDGELVATGEGTFDYSSGVVAVGASIAGGQSGISMFSGLIQGVGVWARELSQTDVDALYNNGDGYDVFS